MALSAYKINQSCPVAGKHGSGNISPRERHPLYRLSREYGHPAESLTILDDIAALPRQLQRALLVGCMLSHFSCVQLFVTPFTVGRQAPLSMGFFRQEYWSGLPCPPPVDLSNPGIEPVSLTSPALAGGFFTTSTTWEACTTENTKKNFFLLLRIRVHFTNMHLPICITNMHTNMHLPYCQLIQDNNKSKISCSKFAKITQNQGRFSCNPNSQITY